MVDVRIPGIVWHLRARCPIPVGPASVGNLGQYPVAFLSTFCAMVHSCMFCGALLVSLAGDARVALSLFVSASTAVLTGILDPYST